MAKLRINGKKKNSIVKLKVVVQKLQKSLLLAKKPDDFEDVSDSTNVPEDVKEGHFAVIAVDDGENKRFVVPLSYLTHPSFSRLLEQAAEEYGFDHEGVVMVPCQPKELERMLAEQWGEETERGYMANGNCSSSKTLVKSC